MVTLVEAMWHAQGSANRVNFVREATGSASAINTDYPHWGVSRFTVVCPGKCEKKPLER